MALSHLQFADDTILFCLAKERVVKNYKRILECFGLIFGLALNLDKSALIPINCLEEKVDRMKECFDCSEATLPITYLGIPLGANPRRVATWRPIINKIEKKLDG